MELPRQTAMGRCRACAEDGPDGWKLERRTRRHCRRSTFNCLSTRPALALVRHAGRPNGCLGLWTAPSCN